MVTSPQGARQVLGYAMEGAEVGVGQVLLGEAHNTNQAVPRGPQQSHNEY